MIRINLLPYRAERKKETVRNQVFAFLIFLVVAILGMIGFHMHLKSRIEELNGKIEYTKKEIDKYNKIAKKVEEVKKLLDELQKKLDVIKDLEKRRRESFNLLDTLSKLIVENRMWIINFQAMEKVKVITKGKGKDATRETIIEIDINIEGRALDDPTVAEFMSRLENAKNLEGEDYFTNEMLVFVRQEPYGHIENMRRFQIQCKNLPLKAKPETDKEKKK